MEKPWGIFVYFNSCFYKRLVVGTGELIHNFFVRYAGCCDADIDTALGGEAEGCLQFVVYDEIGCENIHIILGLGQNIDVYIFRKRLIVQRRIAEGAEHTRHFQRMPRGIGADEMHQNLYLSA